MGITDLVTGGFGTLGQGVGAGAEGIVTQMDYDKLASEVDALFRQGASPQQASQILTQKYPQLGGGQPGGAGGMGQPPRPNVPGMNQPNVVPQMIGPSSQMQTPGGGYGTLGAPQQAPQQSAPPQQPYPTVGQTSPAMERWLAAGDESRSTPRNPGMIPQDQTPIAYPETAPRQAQPQNRMQQTSGAPSQAPQQPGGMGGLITPRNMPLAQLILQQKSQQRAQAVEMEKAKATNDLRASVESMKEEGRNARTVYGAEAKSNLASANIASLMQRAELQNDTRVMDILMRARVAYAKLEEEARQSDDRGNIARAKLAQTAPALKALTQSFAAASNAYSRSLDPSQKAQAEEALAGIYALVGNSDAYEEKVQITPGKTETVETPGRFFGTNQTKVTTPPSAKVPQKTPAKKSRADELGL